MIIPLELANQLLKHNHYLGPTKKGTAYMDDGGVIVFSSPTSRRLPREWVEISRWCIINRDKNAGSKQWGRFIREFKKLYPKVTTLVSYSDPSQGHTGALYRACNWVWAPTWLRIRPPPSGNGKWSNKNESVKDRWVFIINKDINRKEVLKIKDTAILRRNPGLIFTEPNGVKYEPR